MRGNAGAPDLYKRVGGHLRGHSTPVAIFEPIDVRETVGLARG
jgi:hypothetical protein